MKVSEYFRAIGGVSTPGDPGPPTAAAERVKGPGISDFQKILDGQVPQSLRLSSHAQTRIQSRSIPWGPELEKRISAGIDAAEQKGSREALILADDVAVIANVRSRLIVTAIERSQMKEHVFTNIDSAVLV